jgi:hypothetical protein
MHSRVVTGILIEHNTVGRLLYVIGLTDSPVCDTRQRKEHFLMFFVDVKF